jgi:hypothetical protein
MQAHFSLLVEVCKTLWPFGAHPTLTADHHRLTSTWKSVSELRHGNGLASQ